MALTFGSDGWTRLLLFLLWTVLVLLFLWVQRRTLNDMTPARKRWALGIRLSVLTLICLALSEVHLIHPNRSLTVLFLVDGSRSMSDQQKEQAQRFIQESLPHKRPKDTVGVLSFGKEADVKMLPVESPGRPTTRHGGPANATNLAQALETALPLIPHNSAGRVVVLSDGNENVGNALAKVPAMTARGVQVHTVVLPSSLQKEALIEKVVAPTEVKIGEPFRVKVVTNALNQQPGRLSLRWEGGEIGKARSLSLGTGRRTQEFEARIDSHGFHRIEAQLETNADSDTHTENNRGLAYVTVRGKPQLLYVASPSSSKYLPNALRKQNIDVVQVPASAMPSSAAAFLAFDSILFSDVPSSEFSASQLEALRVSTRDFGIGFGMVGGEFSFGMGGYRKTPVEEVLPVSMELRKKLRNPSVCVALVIDRSGSMEEGGIGGSKLAYAKDASERAVGLLKPEDSVAVITFTSSAEVQVPPTSVEQAGEIVSGIKAIQAGGGTSVYEGARLAYQTIKDHPAPIKHIILLTDGMSMDPDYRPLVAEMKRSKVTVTSAAIGGGSGGVDASRLYWLAEQTGGRFYRVESPRDIPAIYMQEIERISTSPLVEEPFNARIPRGAEERLAGLGPNLPLLLGYNVTETKPGAELLLSSHRNDPLLATWRYGLGRSMAFTSDDKNRWAVQWLPWSGYGPFWAQAVRWTMRSFTPSDFRSQVTMEGTRGHVTVTAIDKDGKFVNRLQFKARVASPEGDTAKPQELAVRQTGPGTYEAWFDAGQIGTYLVNVVREVPGKAAEMSVAGLVVPYSPEYRDLRANDYLMTQLAQAGGGVTAAKPAEAFGGSRPVLYKPTHLTQWLLALALLLFPVDVGIRRLALEKSDLRRATGWLRARFGRRLPDTTRKAATSELARLIETKRTAKATSQRPPAIPERPVEAASQPQPPETSSVPPAAADPIQPPPEKGATMDRLMDAKRRAQERREEE